MYDKSNRGTGSRSSRKVSRSRTNVKAVSRSQTIQRSTQDALNVEAALSPFWAWRITQR